MVNRQPLPGSERTAEQGSTVVGQCDPAERIEVFVILRRQRQAQFDALMSKIEAGDPSVKPLSREAFAKDYGASPDDIAKVKAFAVAHGLTVMREDPAARQVLLSGTIAQFQTAFGVKLEHYQHHTAGQFRGRTGTISVPDDLHGIVQAVLGLDNRPQARPHFRIRPPFQPAKGHPVSFTPLQLASLYQFPQGDGSGECVGIIELGGGYNTSDLKSYFASLGVASPKVTPVGVDQGSNQPSGDPNGPDGEVTLDIEIVGAIVPGAAIAVYFTQNSDAGFIDAVSRAVHDTTNNPSVVSISWGGPESSWTSQSLQAFNSLLQTAAALGVTVCAASGDSGSSDGSGSDQVDFPASSPYVLACGGTNLSASGTSISHEVVWNDGAQGGASGGGVSRTFPVPVWQQGLSATSSHGGKTALSGRGVPDVAGDASPVTGYSVLIDGTQTVVGGTSAVAPLWAALIARINAAKGHPVGFINPKLYKVPGACNDITQGNNGSFAASPGWDACTGLGSPDGQKVAAAL
ncbi:protease pro-enzyme activation domain-containing protein [Paraburkholderia domus]|uniref:Pseudomonalisin n=1 Tax=Paraburkholderia domus TaxID=2793075 RepID=A0A9N8N8B9_9BURK|nr:S53 family peptidase [Paraburkholderia domus]MBK5053909.1 S8/S53 family peptidase [Burkholderia sp. R-70006]MBK5063962.1 S8/S53 family peptidase [Burkholderia sp. R-70199]MBK5125547.1 S8/S53 family peptidase [Burkholderia sp. R-69980]MBK5169676.1 S8/S53 family peptidase [Burkholderia sp. R-70211]MBK5185378.1 S8/S53 family peptidase [Burkholderia sp. R-69749]